MPYNVLAAGGFSAIPAGFWAAVAPLALATLALDIACLVDLARAKSVRNVPKWVWVIVILFVSAPIGALIYLFVGRDQGAGGGGGPGSGGASGGGGTGEAELGAGEESGAGGGSGVGGGGGGGTGSGGTGGGGTGGGGTGGGGAGGGGAGPAFGGGAPGADGVPQVTEDRLARDPVPGDRVLGNGAPGDGAPGERAPVISTSGLTRDYGGAGLFDVDLVVPRGCVYGLVGPNGAGKTTLLSLLSAVRRPDRGTVSTRVPRNKIAVCSDVPEFDGWLTAAEVVDLARSLVAPGAGGQAVAAALATAGLADAAGRRVAGFSRGMIQRLGLACALVGEPELLILDEPTSALDPAGRAEMLNLVAAMRGHRTVIFSSHILADVQRIADQVGILRAGRLIYQGATKDLIDTYLEPSWLVRIAGEPAPVAAALAAQPWVTRVGAAGPGALRVDATGLEAGERGIPAVLAGCGARQVSCEPVAADLESAFLALTGASA
jgi:ABC-2 type transport system ATP-binding protein